MIIGFALFDRGQKCIWEYLTPKSDPLAMSAARINPYLVDGAMVALPNRRQPLSAGPKFGIGNKPIDGGFFLFTPEEKATFLVSEPGARPFFRRWIGSDEFISNLERWFLWLVDVPPDRLRPLTHVRQRLRLVGQFRSGEISGKNGRRVRDAATKALAATPTKLHVMNAPKTRFFVIPEVSSEERRFIPMGYVAPRFLASNLLKVSATVQLFHFGILTSTMHMAWVRGVCGRLKSDFRYSSGIVYNNFPWPDPTPTQRAAIETAAQGVLDARAAHPGATLADLYDPVAMPPNLVAAHRKLDQVVDAAYGAPRGGWPTEAQRLAFLFARYEAAASGGQSALSLPKGAAKPKPRRKRAQPSLIPGQGSP